MTKQLITLIGVLVSIAVVAIGVFVVALPLYMESLSTQAAAYGVSQTNAVYQQQIESLRAEEERSDEIAASVNSLQAQIPVTDQFDDVFEVIATAAGSTGVTVTSITAGESTLFVPRTEPAVPGQEGVAPAVPTPTPDPSTTAAPSDPGAADGAGNAPTPPASGRSQSTFTILVSAPDMNAVTVFLDALRAGPRLLQPALATVISTGVGIDVQVEATTFMDARVD